MPSPRPGVRIDAVELTSIDYVADGATYTGYLADGSQPEARAPGIVVVHEGAGLNEPIKERTRRLAALGYVAFAMDLFGDPDQTLSLDEKKEIVRALRADRGALFRRTNAALDVLREHQSVDPRQLAGIGHCFGGTAVLELARQGLADLACAVGFHAGLDAEGQVSAGTIRAKILVLQGDLDPIIGPDQRATFASEMRAAEADWQMVVYGGVGHSFTNPEIDTFDFEGFAYDASADARSWEAMRALLAECFGGGR